MAAELPSSMGLMMSFSPPLNETFTIMAAPGTDVELTFKADISQEEHQWLLDSNGTLEVWTDLPSSKADPWHTIPFDLPRPPTPKQDSPKEYLLSGAAFRDEPPASDSVHLEAKSTFAYPSNKVFSFTYRVSSASGVAWLGESHMNGIIRLESLSDVLETYGDGWVHAGGSRTWRGSPSERSIIGQLRGDVEWTGWCLNADGTSVHPFKLTAPSSSQCYVLFPQPRHIAAVLPHTVFICCSSSGSLRFTPALQLEYSGTDEGHVQVRTDVATGDLSSLLRDTLPDTDETSWSIDDLNDDFLLMTITKSTEPLASEAAYILPQHLGVPSMARVPMVPSGDSFTVFSPAYHSACLVGEGQQKEGECIAVPVEPTAPIKLLISKAEDLFHPKHGSRWFVSVLEPSSATVFEGVKEDNIESPAVQEKPLSMSSGIAKVSKGEAPVAGAVQDLSPLQNIIYHTVRVSMFFPVLCYLLVGTVLSRSSPPQPAAIEPKEAPAPTTDAEVAAAVSPPPSTGRRSSLSLAVPSSSSATLLLVPERENASLDEVTVIRCGLHFRVIDDEGATKLNNRGGATIQIPFMPDNKQGADIITVSLA